jgi:hypothetical protein
MKNPAPFHWISYLIFDNIIPEFCQEPFPSTGAVREK